MNHNTTIIMTISIVITILLLVYSVRAFLLDNSSGQTGITGGVELSQIETLLKKVLEKSHNVTTVADASDRPQAGGLGEELLAEVKRLQEELKQKQAEIEAVKIQSSQSAGLSREEKLKLEDRIKELEAKLSEYEIIAEDIADLSRFKEENATLKKKIEELEKAKVTQALPESTPSSQTDSGEIIDDDLMAEFARAVEQQKQVEHQKKIEGQKKDEKSILSNSNNDSVNPEMTPLSQTEGSVVNLESILTEAASLDESSPDAEVVNSLEQEINSERLAAEASSLNQIVKGEDIELMDNFEQFIKGR
jgi:hypothetical protein